MTFLVEPYGMLQEGESQYAAAQYSAESAQMEAASKARMERARGRAVIGATRAAISKSGATSEGTPIMVLAESAANAELDALTTLYSGEREANLIRAGGAAARKASQYRAASSLINSGTQAAKAAG